MVGMCNPDLPGANDSNPEFSCAVKGAGALMGEVGDSPGVWRGVGNQKVKRVSSTEPGDTYVRRDLDPSFPDSLGGDLCLTGKNSRLENLGHLTSFLSLATLGAGECWNEGYVRVFLRGDDEANFLEAAAFKLTTASTTRGLGEVNWVRMYDVV